MHGVPRAEIPGDIVPLSPRDERFCIIMASEEEDEAHPYVEMLPFLNPHQLVSAYIHMGKRSATEFQLLGPRSDLVQRVQ